MECVSQLISNSDITVGETRGLLLLIWHPIWRDIVVAIGSGMFCVCIKELYLGQKFTVWAMTEVRKDVPPGPERLPLSKPEKMGEDVAQWESACQANASIDTARIRQEKKYCNNNDLGVKGQAKEVV